jgi:hypothetical protein
VSKTAPRFWPYAGRLILVHIVVYLSVASVFLALETGLPAASQAAFAIFQPYRPIGWLTIAGQLLRALIIALVLYPFYGRIVWGRYGGAVLFGALWGIALVGSVEPMPGSIEGLIYTESPWPAHLTASVAVAVQMAIFAGLFLWWERQSAGDVKPTAETPSLATRPIGYALRFVAVHVLTYTVAGLLLFTLQNYEAAFAVEGQFEMYRSLDHPLVALAVPLQILRGLWLALFFSPFHDGYVARRRGWLLLYGLVLGLIALASPNFMTVVVEGMIEGKPLAQFLIGPVEIALQTLLFSGLLFWWERRVHRRRTE